MGIKYKIIYADPPWRYSAYVKKGKGIAARHYSTMKTEDICRFNVAEIADDDTALFLWATFPQLNDALKVIEAWGFRYKTVAFVWIKLNRKNKLPFLGLGFWTRSNAEVCLLATKGHPKRVSKSVRQVILSKVESHSKKPDEARDRIVELLGPLPRIELFAREKTDGWDIWGNEVKNDICLEFE